MKKINLVILGALGVVGQEMLKVLEERNFQVNNLRLLEHKKFAGTIVRFQGKEYKVEETKENSFDGSDITLIAVGNSISEYYMPFIKKSGSLAIDNSSAFRLKDDVPLIVPEINPEEITNHNGIIANPNCSTIIGLVAINELNKYAHVNRMIVSTYQAVSGAGIEGMAELRKGVIADTNNEPFEPKIFQHEIAFNLIPHIDTPLENGYTKEEMKMFYEGRKILKNDKLMVNCTCVRVPVMRSHSESITIETEKDITIEKARELLKNAPGVKLVDDLENGQYPMPKDSSNQDLIYVGRIRRDISKDGLKSITLWCCGDQIRKGAATNAVQIAELAVEKGIV
ncbi:MAG: aspartate-semialdehyde dehydrogenase [Tissierellales bacterium]|nr:aspartate-semialdehyde dehydrogenase [Tissierellales bacterium]